MAIVLTLSMAILSAAFLQGCTQGKNQSTVWDINFKSDVIWTPILNENMMYVRTGKEIIAVDLIHQSMLWKFPLRHHFMNQPLAYGNGMVVAPNEDGQLVAVNAETGKQLWVGDTSKTGEVANSIDAILVSAQATFVAHVTSWMLALDNATGKEIWRAPTPDRSEISLFEHGNALFMLGDQWLFVYDKASGDLIKRTSMGGLIHEAQLIDDSLFMAVSSNVRGYVNIIRFSIMDQTIEKLNTIQTRSVQCIVVNQERLIASGDGLFLLDPNTGDISWQVETDHRYYCPALWNGSIVVRDDGKDLYRYSIANGELVERIDLPGEIFYSPWYTDPIVYGDLLVIEKRRNHLGGFEPH